MNTAKIKGRIKSEYSRIRFKHTMGVYRVITRLSRKFGVDSEKSKLAALLHDFGRNMPVKGIKLDAYEKKNHELVHSKLSAYYAKKAFGVKQIDVLNSILYHTTGSPKMSMLTKILFIADHIEPSRTHNIRKASDFVKKGDIDSACLEIIKTKFHHVLKKNYIIHPRTIAAYNYLVSNGEL